MASHFIQSIIQNPIQNSYLQPLRPYTISPHSSHTTLHTHTHMFLVSQLFPSFIHFSPAALASSHMPVSLLFPLPEMGFLDRCIDSLPLHLRCSSCFQWGLPWPSYLKEHTHPITRPLSLLLPYMLFLAYYIIVIDYCLLCPHTRMSVSSMREGT